MCHLILVMPMVALPVLWLLPLGEGLPLYLAVLLVTGAVYWLAIKAMRAPVVSGKQTVLRRRGSVRSADGNRGSVWVASELWSAESRDTPLAVGDAIEVVGIDGLRLIVRKINPVDGDRAATRPAH
jgi:membrane-bound ClpP family serine protease